MAWPRGYFKTFLSHSQDGLKLPILSHHLLGDNGGVISLVRRRVATCHLGSTGGYQQLTLNANDCWERAFGWSEDLSLVRGLGSRLGRSMGSV